MKYLFTTFPTNDLGLLVEAYAEGPFAAELNGVIDEASFRCLHAVPVSVVAIR